MRIISTIIGVLTTLSCSQPENTNTVDKTIIEDKNTVETVSTIDEECVFDLSSQTDKFMSEIPEYTNYLWDDKTKTASVYLDNGDTLKITRGGCTHFNYYIKLITNSSDSMTINNHDYVLDQARELAKIIFPKKDYQLIDSLVTNKLFEKQLSKSQNYFDLTQELYCDMSIIMKETKSGQFILEIGYFLC